MQRTLTDKALATKLKTQFGKGTERTKAYDQWSVPIKKIFRSRLTFDKAETPVIAFYQPNDYVEAAAVLFFQSPPDIWCVVTTRRIAWINFKGQFTQLKIEDIESVEKSDGPAGWSNRDRVKDVTDSRWLQLNDKDGESYDVLLEVGTGERMKVIIDQLLTESIQLTAGTPTKPPA